MKTCIFIGCAVSLLIIAPFLFAEDEEGIATSASASAPSPLSEFDRSFVHAIKLYAWHEVEIGRVAEQRASSEEIRAFGATLANQSSRLSAGLTDIAVPTGARVPPESTAGHSRTWYELQKLEGSAFDQRFIAEVRRDQQDAIRIFNQEIKRGSNAQLRQFAVNSLSMLEQNLAAANQLSPPAKEEQQELRAEERARWRREDRTQREPTPSNPAGGTTTSHWQY